MIRALSGLVTALGLAALLVTSATAQTLPSMKFKRGELVSPAAALGFYGTGPHSTGLPSPAFDGRPPEIVEVARALKGDADLMFEFVRNHVRTEFAFGSRKGALGAYIDRSGTPFDQAQLLVEIARQSGLSARYRVGQIEMPLSAFQAWSQAGDLTSACRLLADAGIPGECLTLSGVATVRLLHVWAEIQISGQWYVFDPSFKTFSTVSPRNIQTGAGLVAGAAATQLESGADTPGTSPAPFVHNLNAANLDAYLKARGTALLVDIVQSAPAVDTEEVTGRPKVLQGYKPVGGWRLTTPQNYTLVGAPLTISGDLPDAYRVTLRVEVINAFGQPGAVIDQTLFTDEIYGRRLELDTNFDRDHINSPQAYYDRRLRLELDDVALVEFVSDCGGPSSSCVPGIAGDVRLTVDHPYRGGSGTYGDDTVTKAVSLALPVAILQGYGEVSSELAAKWGSERAEDEALPLRVAGNYACDPSYKCNPEFEQRAGDFARQKMAASWLAQFSRMFELQTRISGTVGQHHHSIGVVTARYDLDSTTPQPLAQPQVYDYVVSDQYTALDIDTAVSISSRTNDAVKVKAVSRAVALSASVLEGSIVEQLQDLPDGTSTASRFAWANRPEEDPCGAGARRFYNYFGVASLALLTVFEGSEGGCPAGVPALTATQVGLWQGRLEQALARFQSEQYSQIVSSAEAFLGPGWRVGAKGAPSCVSDGPCAPGADKLTRQRGGAIIATRFDLNGDVLEISHVVTDSENLTKGGGGKSPAQQANFDPARAADVLKDRFVDRASVLGVDLKTGTAGYTTPVLNSIGSGETPARLDFQLTYKAGVACGSLLNFGPCFGPDAGGWASNWDLNFNLSGSGLEAMGETTPRGAAGTLAAFWVMQDLYADTSRSELQRDVYAALVGDWWRRQMVQNVATFTQGAAGRQHVRQVDGTWFSPDRAAAILVQTTPADPTPVKVRDTCPGEPVSTRRWKTEGVNFQLRNSQGDTLEIGPWTATYGAQVCNITYGFKVNRWAWPSGQAIAFSHSAFGDVTGLTTSLGRSVNLPEDQFVALGRSAGRDYANSRITNAAGELTQYEEAPTVARAASQRPVPYPRLSRVYEPAKDLATLAVVGANLAYVYDSTGKVSEAWDATALQWSGSRDPHRFFIVERARGERLDPAGGRYKVDYDPDGDAVRVLDELDRITTAIFDGRHRAATRTFPEGNSEQFTYDDRDNVLSLTRTAKPGAPAPNSLTITASWDSVWNKPNAITDPAGRVTSFQYYDASFGGASGQLRFAVRPAATVGGTQPIYAYEYDARGLISKTVDPTGRVTLFSSDVFGNRASMTRGAASVDGLAAANLVTTYNSNSFGDLTAQIDPRNNATTYDYDAMRRKTLQYRREGGSTGTVRALSSWWYDASSRPTHEYRATGIANDWASGWQLWETRYSPTGQVREQVDPSGDVSRSAYDGMDRLVRTIDGAARLVQNDYDLAGQLTAVRHGVGTPEEITYQSSGYTLNGQRAWVRDARSNQTNFTYNGFDQLLRTTYPDATYDENRYDLVGNIDRWRTRENLFVEWGYDRLDRRVSERAVAADGVTPTPNIEWFRLGASTYAYDLAGRLTQHSNAAMTRDLTYDVVGRVSYQFQNKGGGYFVHLWDAADNLYGLYFPDTSAVSYSYDALNRMIGAGTGGGTALIGYDALSRRTGVTFGDGSTQAYAYEPDNDLASIGHDFAGSTDDVTYSYGYDGAGRETSVVVSNSAYQYAPAVQTQAYAAANAMNQYPTVDGRTFTHRGDGNIAGDGLNWFSYNELGGLRRAWTQDFSIHTTYDIDALGQRTYARYAQPSALDPGIMYLAGAHRPEVAAERIDLENASTAQMVAQGWRNHALGPNADERLITVEGGSPRYPHTDRHGSTIALSQGGSALAKFAYDAYGRPTVATTWGVGPGAYAWRYTGQFQDPFTGHQHYKARDYAAAYGRFLQTDPIGDDDDINLYAYVGNDPVNKTDPTGMYADLLIEAVSIGLGAKSAVDNFRSGKIGAGVVDSLGVVADTALAVIPGVPGGVGLGIQASRKGGNIIANAAQGARGEAATAAKLGDKVAGRQVTFKTSDGTRTRADFVTKDRGVVETKTGGANLTKGQQKLFNDVDAGRSVTPVGQNAKDAGLRPGEPIRLKSCSIDRPSC